MPPALRRSNEPPESAFRVRLHEVIFGTETPAGRAFDVCLIAGILASLAVVMLDSVAALRDAYGDAFLVLEWCFTALFTVEFVLRCLAVKRPAVYARSFYGVVDILSILPTYLSLLFPGSHYFLVIRSLRLLRVFRVLKLVQYLSEAEQLWRSLRASGRKIAVFLFAVVTLVVIFGSLIYVVEGAENGFTSIPRSIYWAIVTLTTVGYGDISPRTGLGQFLAAVIMILGFGIIAVPTGIVTAEIAARGRLQSAVCCPACGEDGHDDDAEYCKHCGSPLAAQ